jgi:hypothetical protein
MAAVLLIAATCGTAGAKSAANSPYVVAFEEQSPFYARCIPDKSRGSEGTTQILCLQPKGDEVIATYAWYNRNGIVMGWSPKAGKVAVMRVRQEEGVAVEKQIEFSFYLGDQCLASYTTADLVKLGAKVELDAGAIEAGLDASSKRAVYRVAGCKQVWNTNDYYFSVRLDETQALSFDILTGKLCRIEKDGSQERLVPLAGAATEGAPVGSSEKSSPQESPWHILSRSPLALASAERALYERKGSPHFFIKVRITNRSADAIGVDLRSYREVIYPNQWGLQPTDGPREINERRLQIAGLDDKRRSEVLDAFRKKLLTAIPAGTSLAYFCEFNAGGRKDVEKQRAEAKDAKFCSVSMDGQLLLTDGHAVEQITCSWKNGRSSTDTDVVVPFPIAWKAIPETALIVEDK